MLASAFERASRLSYGTTKREREDDDEVCPSKRITLDDTLGSLEARIANPQVMFKNLYVRIRDAMNDDILRQLATKASLEAPNAADFARKLDSLWTPAPIGALGDVATFRDLGICSFAYPPAPSIYADLRKQQVSGNDGRTFAHFVDNNETWRRLDPALRDKLTAFVLEYFATFPQNHGQDVIGVSNLIITPADRNKKLVIQKLHLDHMYGFGHEVVVAIDFSGEALRSRYFTGSHRIDGFSWGFNRRLNKGQGDLGSHSEPGLACNASRVADMLVHAMNSNIDVRYAEAPSNGMVFDAGGLHSGNAVFSKGPRVFWTFRTAAFHNKYTRDIREIGEREFMTQDTWFPQRDQIHLGTVG